MALLATADNITKRDQSAIVANFTAV